MLFACSIGQIFIDLLRHTISVSSHLDTAGSLWNWFSRLRISPSRDSLLEAVIRMLISLQLITVCAWIGCADLQHCTQWQEMKKRILLAVLMWNPQIRSLLLGINAERIKSKEYRELWKEADLLIPNRFKKSLLRIWARDTLRRWARDTSTDYFRISSPSR